jgi:hypothetical protein
LDEYGKYLTFARGLTQRFAERVVGLDQSAARILKLRPADQVLGGFLTPARTREDADDDGPIEDLPQDSAYEQTALGLEWLAPVAGLGGTWADVRIALSVYVRVMPTFDEQAANLSWKSTWRRAESKAPVEPEADIVPVWRRVDLEELGLAVELAELCSRRRLVLPLTADLRAAWLRARAVLRDRYPTASPLTIRKSAFTKNGFESWGNALKETEKAEDWAADIDIRFTSVPTEPGCGRVSLRVINRTPARDQRSSQFFDPNLYAVRVTVQVPSAAHKDGTFRELEQSYRYDLGLPAVGINCHALIEHRQGAIILRTDPVPRKESSRLEPRKLEDAVPAFETLRTDPVPLLRSLLAAMRDYDSNDWQAKIDKLSGNQRKEAERDRHRFRNDEIEPFERGIALLEDPNYPLVARAFRLMNEAMSDVAIGKGLDPERLGVRRVYNEWHLFQIVFIVAQLPALAAREYSELKRPGDESVDILWFPAGGGKTEAFLGLVVWQAFFDRLRGKRFGPAALVRFPLRLLAFQQLQRIARALACADVIRARENLGGARFSLGYYVGGTQTPNSIDDDRHQRYTREGVERLDRRITECPYCSSEVQCTYEKQLRMIEHRCTARSCHGGPDRLPVYIVDRDIERFLPTVVIATVDKLAQFGQQQRFANLFGRITLMCGRHGASFRNTEAKCSAAKALGPGPETSERLTQCDGKSVIYPPFHDPSPALLIQDELHLLSEELGTFDAHYETAVMHLERTLGREPWKIIAATATITNFEEHAQQLYLKVARQFPAPGPEAYESFYYAADHERIGRIFVGLLGVARKHTPAVTKALSLLYQELQQARDLAKLNIDEACARYGLRTMAPDEFRLMLFYYELALTYVLTRKGSDQVAEAIESRVKRELAEVAPDAGELHVETFNGSVDMGEMIEAMRNIERADPALDAETRTRGLVTTNIIGHGVDVDRFNIIVFAGFTRLVAEYIQASARVGRRYPGISILVATPQSERDRSIYERFAKFHEYLDRLVDPAAVNRWPIPALRRTVPGLLAGYLMGGAAGLMDRRLENVERVQEALGALGSEPLQEAEVVKWMQNALGAIHRPSYAAQVENMTKNFYALVVNAEPSSRYFDNLLNVRLQAMRSLRDVDDPADIVVENNEDVAVMKVLRRG